MKICLLGMDVNPPWVEGSRKYIFNLAKYLSKQGNEVHIVTTQPRNEDKNIKSRKEKIEDIQFHRGNFLPVYTESEESILNKLTSHISLGIEGLRKGKEKNFDMIHGFSAAPLLAFRTLLLGRILNSKCVHSLLNRSYVPLLGNNSINFHLHSLDILILNNSFLKKNLFNKKPSNLRMIPEGIDINKYSPNASSSIRKELNMGNKNLILYVGHLYPEKGVKYFIKSAKKIISEYPHTKFVIAFSGIGNLDPIKKLIKKENLQKYFEIIGQREDIAGIFAEADVFVSPLKTDKHTLGNPLTILEAMACGTPVVATNLPNVRDIIKNEKNGMLVEPKCGEKIADAVIKILECSDLQSKFSKNGRKTIENKFRKKENYKKIQLLYNELVG